MYYLYLNFILVRYDLHCVQLIASLTQYYNDFPNINFIKPLLIPHSQRENEEAAKAKHGMFYISDYILHENK